jgi:hypothetical protein
MKHTNTLLTRDKFRELVFARDDNTCVFCELPAVDAHHIMERRLWTDGGYYLNNGASVCEEHHIKCETTEITVEDVRIACGITKPILPAHLYHDQLYDKWGNPILANGNRVRGELFQDSSVQKILKRGKVLDLFTHWVKYPRTYHLPWSAGVPADDKIMASTDTFVGKRVIITEKMDGENTTLYSDYIHARSVDGRSHPSRDWVKRFWSSIAYDIPEGWRVCGENLYAQHSIAYDNLPTYFMGFSIWSEKNRCLDWDSTVEWFEILDIIPPPVIYDGVYDEKLVRSLWNDAEWANKEGYVMRVADGFEYGEFKTHVGKFVRSNHVQTTKHWMFGQPIVPNKLQGV